MDFSEIYVNYNIERNTLKINESKIDLKIPIEVKFYPVYHRKEFNYFEEFYPYIAISFIYNKGKNLVDALLQTKQIFINAIDESKIPKEEESVNSNDSGDDSDIIEKFDRNALSKNIEIETFPATIFKQQIYTVNFLPPEKIYNPDTNIFNYSMTIQSVNVPKPYENLKIFENDVDFTPTDIKTFMWGQILLYNNLQSSIAYALTPFLIVESPYIDFPNYFDLTKFLQDIEFKLTDLMAVYRKRFYDFLTTKFPNEKIPLDFDKMTNFAYEKIHKFENHFKEPYKSIERISNLIENNQKIEPQDVTLLHSLFDYTIYTTYDHEIYNTLEKQVLSCRVTMDTMYCDTIFLQIPFNNGTENVFPLIVPLIVPIYEES